MSYDLRFLIAGDIERYFNGKFQRRLWTKITVRQIETTSGCPLIELTLDGERINITITKARKP